MKFCKRPVNNLGFSLLETVIASTLAMIIGILLIQILSNNTGFYYKETSNVNEGLSSNDASRVITDQILQSSAVAASYPETGTPLYSSGTNTIVLKLPSTSASGVIANTYDYIIITTDSSNPAILRYLVYPDTSSNRKSQNQVLTTLLSEIKFFYFDKNGTTVSPVSASVIQTDLTIDAKNGTIDTKRTTTSKTTLRNL